MSFGSSTSNNVIAIKLIADILMEKSENKNSKASQINIKRKIKYTINNTYMFFLHITAHTLISFVYRPINVVDFRFTY